jgi:site-specific recombinase XerD
MFRASKNSKRDNLILRCLFYLGLRNSELQKLRIGDIDLINRNVKVVSGKGEKDRYIVIPNQKLIEDLKSWIGDRREGPLFYISDRHIRRIVKHYAIKANIRRPQEVHPHTLRHSYATYMQNKGLPLNAIQKMLGHENIETTTIYAHLGIEKIRKMVENVFSDFE